MPELAIGPTPTPPASGTGSAIALAPSDPGRTDGTTKTDADGPPESPFAAVLRSSIDRKVSAAEKAGDAIASLTANPADTEDTASRVDLSAFLPLLEAKPAAPGGIAMAPVDAAGQAPTVPDQTPLPELQSAIAGLPAQFAAAPPAQPAAVGDTTQRRHSVEPNDATVTRPELPSRTDGRGPTAGKVALEPAINADPVHSAAESNSSLPAADFDALLSRATPISHGSVGPGNGSAANPSLRIDSSPGQAGWNDELGQKLTWMVNNGRQQADLVLTPPHLGRVEVSLTLNGDQASAIFASSNPAVREALESSLHRLREVLADAGVSLGQAQVGSEAPNQRSRNDDAGDRFGLGEGRRYASAISSSEAIAVAKTGAGRGMIDVFA